MASKNPFSHAIERAQLQVTLLCTQAELYDLLTAEEFWPRVAESICNHGSYESALAEGLDRTVAQQITALGKKVSEVKEQIYALNQLNRINQR